MRAVIIDDVQNAIDTLLQDINNYCPHLQIVGTATSVVQGIKLIHNTQPELVFLDIHMQDGSGFDLLDAIPNTFKVIFVTAFDEHAIKAFNYATIGYLLKPVDPDDLVKTIQKIEGTTTINTAKNLTVAKEHFSNIGPKRISLNTQDKIYIVNIQDIVYCCSEGNYSVFYLIDAGAKPIMVSTTLGYYSNLLEPYGFYKVHHSYLVNTAHIKEFKKDACLLIMANNAQVQVSDRKKAEVKKMLEQL
jgi:two-component system, LytTR family, response regulator